MRTSRSFFVLRVLLLNPSTMATVQDQVNSNTVLVHLILDFVGSGHSLYITTISKCWHGCYAKHYATLVLLEGELVGLSGCTSYAAALASTARVSMALEFGLDLWDHTVQQCAGRYAAIEILLMLKALKLNIASPWISYGAAESHDVPKLRWLREEQQAVFPEDITEKAAAAGSVDALRWLKQQKVACSDTEPLFMVTGMATGVARLQSGRQMGFTEKTFSFDVMTCLQAAGKPGNLAVLRYLHEEGCGWHSSTCGIAAASGDLEQLKWLHQHGAPLDERTATTAASGGSVRIFEWLQQQEKVVFSAATMLAAAEKNHLQLCKWLREHGCPWSARACTAAAPLTRCTGCWTAAVPATLSR
jgi:hypothetical protein